MEQALEIFKHEEFGGVRVIGDADNPRFCLADVCKILEIGNPSQVKTRLDDGVISNEVISDSLGRTQNAKFINEDGLYDVILDSRKPVAKKFRKWITSEVLPLIRKQGMYINPNAPIDPRFLRRMADELEIRDKKIAELQPKADYCEKVLQSPEALNVTVIAKDYGMSGVMFNQLLYSLKIQYRSGKTWVLYQEYLNKGYVVTEPVITKNGGTATQMKWTQKGRFFLYNTLKKHGKVPLSEREEPISLFGGVA